VFLGRRQRSGLALLVALSLALLSVLSPAAARPVAAAGALPDCRYDDVMTEHTSTRQWRNTLLDSIYMVPSSYAPPGLVSSGDAGISGGGNVRRLLLNDLAALANAARQAGNPLRIVSAYRSYAQQRSLYQQEVQRYGVERARLQVARPGHSEHQLGTTLDFGSAGTNKKGWHYSDWATTPAGGWLKANGWRFGFVMSYPKGMKSVTCYSYEPWHWRYVGREVAADVRASGLTLREYLWRNFH
jgi:D-alanyl-D-alanine carboxypeptidase